MYLSANYIVSLLYVRAPSNSFNELSAYIAETYKAVHHALLDRSNLAISADPATMRKQLLAKLPQWECNVV